MPVTTNLIVLDRTGTVLLERNVQVRGPQDNVVVVYRGIERETLSCAPRCERRITLGDAPPFFDSAVAQTGTRNTLAVGGALHEDGTRQAQIAPPDARLLFLRETQQLTVAPSDRRLVKLVSIVGRRLGARRGFQIRGARREERHRL